MKIYEICIELGRRCRVRLVLALQIEHCVVLFKRVFRSGRFQCLEHGFWPDVIQVPISDRAGQKTFICTFRSAPQGLLNGIDVSLNLFGAQEIDGAEVAARGDEEVIGKLSQTTEDEARWFSIASKGRDSRRVAVIERLLDQAEALGKGTGELGDVNVRFESFGFEPKFALTVSDVQSGYTCLSERCCHVAHHTTPKFESYRVDDHLRELRISLDDRIETLRHCLC